MELGALLSSFGQVAGAAQGFSSGSTATNLGNLSAGLNQAGAASSGASVLGAAGSMAATGAAIGSIIPGVGTAVGGALGGAIGAIGALISGHGVQGHENPDINKIAAANDIAFQQAADVCAYRSDNSSDNFDDVCSRAAGDRGYFQQILAVYNAAHPGGQVQTTTAQLATQYAQVKVQAASMFSGNPSANPLATLSLQGAQQAAASQSMSLEEYLKTILAGALQGAQAGAAGAAADTPAGQSATNATLKAEAIKYQLPIFIFISGIIALAYKAFKR